MNRREFLKLSGAAGAVLALPGGVGAGRLGAGRLGVGGPGVGRRTLTLTAGVTTHDIGTAAQVPAWTLNGSLPSPILRFRRGETAEIELVNRLPEPTILHWHGLDVPEAADGHPRLVIDPGERYDYRFPVIDPPGLYWYHPHPHMRTAAQTYQGMAGLLVVEDDTEEAFGLPGGDRELLLVLRDRRSGDNPFEYRAAMGPDMMLGYLGDVPFTNGVPNASLPVRRATYRLRLLNASNARIFDLGMSNGAPLTLLGTDGGYLERPVTLPRMMLATGERADLLVDFSAARPGERIVLRSFAFDVPGMMGGMGMGGMGRGGGMMRGRAGVPPQGAAMDLVEFVVGDAPAEAAVPAPARLSSLAAPELGGQVTHRTFRFDSEMMRHSINGRAFEMERVDVRVPRGRTEVWTLENPSMFPHPVHIHAGRFRVLDRAGGRERVMPWEAGLKDTVLVLPGERVDVAVRFEEYRGLFLMHCHNLEHEDHGMMLNFLVE